METIYEVTLEVETKLFRQQVTLTINNTATVAKLRSPAYQRQNGFKFVSVRGPIAVLENSTQVLHLLDRERDEANRIAAGADRVEG